MISSLITCIFSNFFSLKLLIYLGFWFIQQTLSKEVMALLPTEVAGMVKSLLNVAQRMDATIGNNQLALSYQGSLDLATIIKEIPGLNELPLDGLFLPVLNPKIEILNPGKNASYNFSAEQLPKQQLLDWLVKQLPAEVKSVLQAIANEAQNLDVVLGNNQIEIGYNGNIDLAKLLALIPGVKDLLSNGLSLPVLNPKITILNPGANASYSIDAEKLPKQQLINWLSSKLPSEVQAVLSKLSTNLDINIAQNQLQLNYRGDVDLLELAGVIPGVKDLPLQGLKLNVTNPSFTLINPGKANADYVFNADRLPTKDLLNWLKTTATNSLPPGVKSVLSQLLALGSNIDLVMGKGQMQLAYNGNLDLAKVIALIPGVKDIGALSGLNLPVTNPSITILNPGTASAQYLLKSDRLPKEELVQWAKEKATELLPADLVKVFNTLMNISEGIDLEVGNNQLEISYEGSVDLATLLKEIPGLNELPLNNLKLPVLNPTLTITNPGKSASYSFAAQRLPKQELINWLKEQAKSLIPTELQGIFNALAAVGEQLDIRFGDSQFQVNYQGDLNLVNILKEIPGLSSFDFTGLTLNVKNPSITITNPGKDAKFSFKADKLPIADLQNWLITKAGNALPKEAQDILNGLKGLAQDVNILLTDKQIQVLYDGTVDVVSLINKIPGISSVFKPPDNALTVTKPSLTLTRVTTNNVTTTDFNFSAEKINKDGLKKWLIDQAASAVPKSVKDVISSLISTAADFEVLFKKNQLQISYPGTLDLASVIKQIPGLSELQATGLTLPITNPVLSISNLDQGASKANYSLTADHLPKQELVDWLTKQAKAALPGEVLNVVEDLLDLARRVDLQIGDSQIQITYEGILDLSDVLEKIPGLEDV